ncbi:MAG: hypothetical protein ACK58T_14625, partial [Phycisphaerae bacterium]
MKLTVRQQWYARILCPDATISQSSVRDTPLPGESPYSFSSRCQLPELVQLRTAGELLDVPVRETLGTIRPAVSFVQSFPISFAREHALLACVNEGGRLELLMSGVKSWTLLDNVRRVLRQHLSPVFASRAQILQVINQAYEQQSAQPDAVLGSLSDEDSEMKLKTFQQRDDLLLT